MICQSHVTVTYMYNFLFIISLVLYNQEFTYYPFLPLTYSIAQHCSVSTRVTYHIYWHDLFAQKSVQSLCLHPAILDKKSGHTKTSQHKPAHASTRQHVHFALFSGFFCIRILVKVFPIFCVKINSKSITFNEILRIF